MGIDFLATNIKKVAHNDLSALLLTFIVFNNVQASDFRKLDEAVPSPLVTNIFVTKLAPVFDFDGDGCLPSAGISRSGEQNKGLKTGGNVDGECRDPHFLNTSNTLHRYACVRKEGSTYCGHFYALYFEKDQISSSFIYKGGHKHDWEWVAVWTKNGIITHGSVSAHGNMETKPTTDIVFENGHMKVVYHKESGNTHCMRFAGKTLDAKAENPYGKFVTPIITSWYNITGEGIDNKTMRFKLNSFDYGNASIPCKDSNFFEKLNKFKPPGYPTFNKGGVNEKDFDIMDWVSGNSCRLDTSGKLYSCPINRIAPRRGDQLTGVVVNMIKPGRWARVCARSQNMSEYACTGKKQSSDREIIFQKTDLDKIRKVPPGWGTYLHVEIGVTSSYCTLNNNCVLGYGVQWDTRVLSL